jgi:hypothetical protein
MTVLATSSNRFSTVVKYELAPEVRVCRDVLTVNDAAATFKVGAVLGRYVASPVGTSAAAAGNTGNGAMGAITVTSNANLQLGNYTVKITKAAANAGDFALRDPQGKVVGTGTVGVAFSQAGFAFTLADGATDFVVGDTFTIAVTGTEKYKLQDAAATDGSDVAKAVFIADAAGNSGDTAIPANTDTLVLAITRGPVIVAQDALTFGANTDTTAEKNAVYASLKALGIIAETTI